MKLKAALFDMDGTLVNSMDDLAQATNYAIKKHGFPERPAENYGKYAGNGIYVMIERALYPAKVSEEELKEIRNDFFGYYESHCTVNTYAYEGVPELIRKLEAKGIKVGCITNKVDKIAHDIINHFFSGMDIVYGQIDGKPNKPDPYFVSKALEEFGIKPEECAFIGDSDVDMQTAENSGTVGIGVLWGFRSAEELKSNGARYLVSRASEILEVFQNHE